MSRLLLEVVGTDGLSCQCNAYFVPGKRIKLYAISVCLSWTNDSYLPEFKQNKQFILLEIFAPYKQVNMECRVYDCRLCEILTIILI